MHRNWQQERGSVMVVTLVTLSGILAVASITLVNVTRGLKTTSQARFQSIALFAAESGVSAGIDFLRANTAPGTYYSRFVSPNNTSIQSPTGIPGNSIEAGQPGNLFSVDSNMSYEVFVLNNPDDPKFASGTDSDGIVILRSVGHGPGTSKVVIEVKLNGANRQNAGRPCPGYAQRGIAADGAGRNDCLTEIDNSVVSTFTPKS